MVAYWWLIAAVCFSLTLIIETSSWCLRARAKVTTQGLYNSRVNIYLYSARFFYLLFMVLMSWAVDNGATQHEILKIIIFAAALSLLAHVAYVFVDGVSKAVDKQILAILIADSDDRQEVHLNFKVSDPLFGWSTFSSFFLMVGVTLPFVIAALFPESRMMISSLGQAVNAVGTVIVLFRVDYAMYQSMDTGRLPNLVGFFVAGRLAALLTVLVVAIIGFFVMEPG